MSTVPQADPFLDLALRLSSMAKELSRWSQRVVGNIKELMAMASEVIKSLDRALDSRQLSNSEFWIRGQLKRHLLGLASLHRSIQRQKSRLLWLREGEGNTEFFQKFARKRRRDNHLFR